MSLSGTVPLLEGDYGGPPTCDVRLKVKRQEGEDVSIRNRTTLRGRLRRASYM